MSVIHVFFFNLVELWHFIVYNEFDGHNGGGGGNLDDDLNIGFIIALSSIISFILLVIVLAIVYLLFFNTGSIGSLSSTPTSVNIPDCLKVTKSNLRAAELLLFNQLTIKEKARYKLARKFFKRSPPELRLNNSSDPTAIANTLLIRERGINIFYFESWYDQISSLLTHPRPPVGISENQIIDHGMGNQGSSDQLIGYKDTSIANRLLDDIDDEDDYDDDEDDEDDDQGEELISTNAVSPATETTSLLPKSIKKLPIVYYACVLKNGFMRKSLNNETIIPPFDVEDLTDISFTSSETSSTILNYPLPTSNRRNDTVYFETKIFEFNPLTTTIAIGLSTKPYPNFLLPGYAQYSLSVDTSGALRMSNRPFPNDPDTPIILPQITEGDVIGIGYKSIQGTVFITHNGRKIVEPVRNLKVEMYPCIGSSGGPCKVQVNLGQLGFVFIEANVKKLGFCENNNEGTIGAPPFYMDVNNTDNSDVILEQGDSLPPHYPSEEESFFGSRSRQAADDDDNGDIIIDSEQHQRVLEQEVTASSSLLALNPSLNSPSNDPSIGSPSININSQPSNVTQPSPYPPSYHSDSGSFLDRTNEASEIV